MKLFELSLDCRFQQCMIRSVFCGSQSHAGLQEESLHVIAVPELALLFLPLTLPLLFLSPVKNVTSGSWTKSSS